MTWIQTSASQLGTERMLVNSWGPWDRQWQYSARAFVGRERLESEKQSFVCLCCREIWMQISSPWSLCCPFQRLFNLLTFSLTAFSTLLRLYSLWAPCISIFRFSACYTKDTYWALIAHKYMTAEFGIREPWANVCRMWQRQLSQLTQLCPWPRLSEQKQSFVDDKPGDQEKIVFPLLQNRFKALVFPLKL